MDGENKKHKNVVDKDYLLASTSCIAHELNTPLLSISSGARGIGHTLEKLVEAYEIAQAQGLDVPNISQTRLKNTQQAIDNIEHQSRVAFFEIGAWLDSLQEDFFTQHATIAVKECLEEALRSYPLREDEKNKLIELDINEFTFLGHYSAMALVFAYLIKQAHYRTRQQSNCRLVIKTEQLENENIVTFEDDGIPYADEDISELFTAEFSQKNTYIGISLAFAKHVLQSVGGNIHCNVSDGKTLFTLIIPRQDT